MAHRPKIPGVVEEKAEPKTFFANERTFLAWLHMALTMGSISAAMLGFSATGSSKAQVRVQLLFPSCSVNVDPIKLKATNNLQLPIHFAQASPEVGLIALILLPVALLICGYALLVFYWRAEAICSKDGQFYDDRRGPLALTAVVISALSFIFLMGLLSLLEDIFADAPPEAGTSSPKEWLRSTLFYQVLRMPHA